MTRQTQYVVAEKSLPLLSVAWIGTLLASFLTNVIWQRTSPAPDCRFLWDVALPWLSTWNGNDSAHLSWLGLSEGDG